MAHFAHWNSPKWGKVVLELDSEVLTRPSKRLWLSDMIFMSRRRYKPFLYIVFSHQTSKKNSLRILSLQRSMSTMNSTIIILGNRSRKSMIRSMRCRTWWKGLKHGFPLFRNMKELLYCFGRIIAFLKERWWKLYHNFMLKHLTRRNFWFGKINIEKGTVLRIKVTLLPCFNWIKFEIFAFRLRTYGGWNRQPVAIGRTHLPTSKMMTSLPNIATRCVTCVSGDTKDIVDLWD